jgi:Flp pilus assembly protein CpaB
MTYRMRNILIAVALAGVAALLVTFYISNYKSSVQHGQAVVTVLVPTQDIPQGTLGSDVVSRGWLKTQQIARTSVVPGAISSPDQIKALVAIAPTYTGEQVTTRRFGPAVQQGIKGELTGTYRAMQLAGDPNQVLAGTLETGDFVDFVGVLPLGGNAGTDFSRIVVRNMKVLQVQNSSASGHIGGGNATSAVMLRMTDAQSQKIAYTYKKGDYWALELRPGLKSADSPNSFETAYTILIDGINRSVVNAILSAAGGN